MFLSSPCEVIQMRILDFPGHEALILYSFISWPEAHLALFKKKKKHCRVVTFYEGNLSRWLKHLKMMGGVV